MTIRLLALVLSVGLVIALLLFIFGVDIDNKTQLLAGRDLRTLQELSTGRGRLEDLVADRYRIDTWKAYHFDELYLTVIDCVAVDRTGKSIVLSWEVGHNYSPRRDVPRKKLTVFALTREAALLTPDLKPAGIALEDYPETWARVFHSSALAPRPVSLPESK